MATRLLYNGGHRLSERLSYTTKNNALDFKELNWNAYWPVDAPAHSFFELPDMVPDSAGNTRIPVYFALDMAKKHGHRGIILIDEEMGTDAEDDVPYAKNQEDAKEKGDRLWHNHLVNTVQAHFDFVADLRAAGRAPKAASFFTRKALKDLGVKDPAELTFEPVKVSKETAADKKAVSDQADKLQKH